MYGETFYGRHTAQLKTAQGHILVWADTFD